MIANAFREHLGARLDRLVGKPLAAAWEGFCRSYAERRHTFKETRPSVFL